MKASASWLDPLGMALSGLCLFHCLALPLLSLVLPALGAWAQAEWVHAVVVALAAPVAAVALQRRPGLVVLGLAGVGAMLLAALGWPSHAAELPLNAAGGLLLVTAHGLNWRRRHRRKARAPV